MTPEERERLRKQRQLALARTGPLSSGILPSDLYSYTQMLPTISDEAWYTLPPERTPEERQAYRSSIDQRTARQDQVVLDYLASKKRPAQADAIAPPVQTDTTAAPVDTTVRPAVSDVAKDAAIDPVIPSIPSGGGLSAAALERLRKRQNKWGGYMDAHAFATGAKSRRKSFDAGLKNIFGTTKDDKFQTVESGDLKYTYHKNPRTGEWTVIAAAPRWEPKQWATYQDANGRERFKEGPYMGRLLSEVAGLPMVEKEQPPTTDITEHEYGENILSEMAKARRDQGVESEDYINAKNEYARFLARSTTAGSQAAEIQKFEYLQNLTTIAENTKTIKGENSPEYLAAKAQANSFAAQIAKGDGKEYKPEVRLFYRTAPAEGEQAQVAGYIDYAGGRPVFRDMNGNALRDVIPIPKAEITTSQQDFIQSLTPVKTEIGEGIVGQIDTAVEIEQFKSLLTDLAELGSGATGLRGIAMESIGGPLGQLSPILERGFAQAIGGVSAEEAANYRNRLRLAVISLIPEYTGEESGRITEAERRLASEASRLLSPAASEIQIRSALRNVLELKLTEQMRSWISAGFDPRYDLTTKEGVDELGDILFNAGFKQNDVIASLTRLINIQKEMKRTYLGSQ